MTAWVPLLVALGAGLGSALRHLAARRLDGHWPLGTLAVNVVGSALAGAATAALREGGGGAWNTERLTALLVVGLAGGLTTLSGLAVQVHDLGWRRGTAYGAGTLVLATAACVASYAML